MSSDEITTDSDPSDSDTSDNEQIGKGAATGKGNPSAGAADGSKRARDVEKKGKDAEEELEEFGDEDDEGEGEREEEEERIEGEEDSEEEDAVKKLTPEQKILKQRKIEQARINNMNEQDLIDEIVEKGVSCLQKKGRNTKLIPYR